MNILAGKLPPPVGTSDWVTFSRDSYCVDKTLLVKELVDRRTRVALFTRPRRFGKTSALQMLRAFFEKTGNDTSHLFADKKIWAAGETYRRLQGRFPVIYLTFKDHKMLTWETAAGKLVRDISTMVGRHRAAVLSDWDTGVHRDQLVRVMDRQASLEEVAEALGLLAEALHVHHGVKPVILIDEYDQPIASASTYGYYDRMVVFMRAFLSSAMKDNAHCEMGIMTGVLRVAKEGILSGLNNLRVWTVFDSAFGEYFGFTGKEVKTMAAYYGVPGKMAEIKAWYDGYDFGGTEIYNPWSVLNYFATDCRPATYWLDTSSNDLIREIVRRYPFDFKDTFEQLLKGGRPRVGMAAELGPYARVKDSADTLYALLVSAGYLKVTSPVEDGRCCVAIPNRELAKVFVDEIRSEMNAHLKVGSDDIIDALLDVDPVALQSAIAAFLRESVSYFDKAKEGFYHGLTLGFLAMLRDRFRVDSNAESGEGRFDIALTPRTPQWPGFVIEVKAARMRTQKLQPLAEKALAQIGAKGYAAKMEAEMKALGSTQPVVRLGLAYYRKRLALVQDPVVGVLKS